MFLCISGTQQLPPMFSLAFHQCRWNYRDQKDVSAVESGFEDLDFPMDVIWLNIEHTDGKRYFTVRLTELCKWIVSHFSYSQWDKQLFPTPIEMQQNVSRHCGSTYQARRSLPRALGGHHQGLLREEQRWRRLDGWCWPGSSSNLDFTSLS